MLLTCPECLTQYNLNPALMGPGGHQMVRCTRCGYVWDFREEDADDATAAEKARPHHEEPVQDIVFPDDDVPHLAQKDDRPETHSATEPDFGSEPSNALSPVPPQHAVDLSAAPDQEEDVLPTFVHKDIHVEPPAPDFVDHQPLGLTANQFGFIAFALLVCASISAALLAKSPIASAYPPSLAFYKAMGVKVAAPGEGMRLSDMSARFIDGDQGRILSVEAKLANISDAVLHYPSLHVEAKSMYGVVLKDWKFHPESTELQPEETIPVKFAFEKVPEETKSIEISAIPSHS